MRTPKPHSSGPGLPGGSVRRGGRAPALPYLRGLGRLWQLICNRHQPPGGRQHREQEQPEGKRRRRRALHFGQAGGG